MSQVHDKVHLLMQQLGDNLKQLEKGLQILFEGVREYLERFPEFVKFGIENQSARAFFVLQVAALHSRKTKISIYQ